MGLQPAHLVLQQRPFHDRDSYYDSCFRQLATHQEYQLDFAASPDVLTAGAWTTRNEWLGADGNMHYPWEPYMLEPKINTITYFSSPGPSRDGRMKPDIAAPGAIIMSTMPANLAGGIANSDKDADMQHQWMWGTSMAAPHATGAVALYFQKFPGHTFANVRYYLSNWAKNDTFTKSIGKNGFGAGKLNVSNLKTPPVARITADKGVLDLSNHDFATFSGLGSYDPDKLPYKYKWTLLAKPDRLRLPAHPERQHRQAGARQGRRLQGGAGDRGRDLQQPGGRAHGAGRANDLVRGSRPLGL